MKKIFVLILLIAISLSTSSCKQEVDFSDVAGNPGNITPEFALHSDEIDIALNGDITHLKKEPIKVTDGSGDGFKWSEYEYYDITVKALKTDDGDKTNIIKITTSSSAYETNKGIKVGDNVERLKEIYNEHLYYQENIDNGDNYLYDPQDDLGFKKIRFYVEDEIIKTIELEDTIDG